ncbi:MAG TPA: response regulator transcription factor [Myxococcota bacterium]|nr:response regulator transcription factor [Myxococcota bacterium]
MEPPAKRIFLVEDDLKLASLVKEFLEGAGFVVDIEPRGDQAVRCIMEENPDLVILDLMLPGLDGLSVCRQVRPKFQNPILMLTALGDEIDEVVGLEIGADDYLVKPVRPRLLLARVHSLLRRIETAATREDDSMILTVGPLILDGAKRTVSFHDQPIELTTTEFDLLWYFAKRAGQVVNREELYLDLRGIEWDGLDRSIDISVARLRKKLGDDGKHPQLIKSIRGAGYLLAGR